jgi:hypothetical protein
MLNDADTNPDLYKGHFASASSRKMTNKTEAFAESVQIFLAFELNAD